MSSPTDTISENTNNPSSVPDVPVISNPATGNGIENPLERGSSSRGTGNLIWFSTMMSRSTNGDSSRANGEVSSIPIDIPDGSARSSSHHRRCRRRIGAMQGSFKDLKKQHGQWSCFLCCHVRTGTIVIGAWHVLLHLIALSLIAIVMVHPEMLHKKLDNKVESERLDITPIRTQDVQAVNCSEMPCLLATQRNAHIRDPSSEFSQTIGNLLSTHRLNSEDINIALFIYICTLIVTLLLIYGAYKGQSSYLMPFFFLQVFDFCISSMTMIGYLSYLPSVRQEIQKSYTFPFRMQLLAMNSKCLTFFVMLFCILTFMIKAYIINVVWRCYKYLMHMAHPRRWSSCIPRNVLPGPVDQESQTLVLGHDLPDYDTAIACPQYRKKVSSLFPEPPPSYDMAMAAFHAQQQIISEAQVSSNQENTRIGNESEQTRNVETNNST